MFAYGEKAPYYNESEAKNLIQRADNLRDEIKKIPQENDPKKTELRKERNAIITRLENIQQHK